MLTSLCTTQDSQAQALTNLIGTHGLQYAQRNYGGLYDYRPDELWDALIIAVERHKEGNINVNTQGDRAVHQVFILESGLFDQAYLDKINDTSTPERSSDEKEDEDHVDGGGLVETAKAGAMPRRSSRRPSQRVTPIRKQSTSRPSRNQSTLDAFDEVDEDATSEARPESLTRTTTMTTTINNAQPSGDHNQGTEIKNGMRTGELVRATGSKRSRSEKSTAKKPTQKLFDEVEKHDILPSSVQGIKSRAARGRRSLLPASSKNGPTKDGTQSEALVLSDEIESEPDMVDTILDAPEARVVDSRDAAEYAQDEAEEEKHKMKDRDSGEGTAIAASSKRPSTLGPTLRNHRQVSRSESDEEDECDPANVSESSDGSDDEDDLSTDSSEKGLTPPASDGGDDHDESEAEINQFNGTDFPDPDDGLEEDESPLREAEYASKHPSTERRSQSEKLKSASPAKRSSEDAFESDPPTFSKRSRVQSDSDNIVSQSGDKPLIVVNDDIEGRVDRPNQQPTPTGLTNDEIRDELRTIKQQISTAVSTFFADTDDVGEHGANMWSSWIARPRNDLEAVYEHVFGSEVPWRETAGRLWAGANLISDNLLRSMLALVIFTKILDHKLPWEVATAVQQPGHQFSSLAQVLADQEIDISAVLWQAVLHQLKDPEFIDNKVMPMVRQLAAECIMTLGEHLQGLMRGNTRDARWHINLFNGLTKACRAALMLKSKLVASGVDGTWVWYHTDHKIDGSRVRIPNHDNGYVALSLFAGIQDDLYVAPSGTHLKVKISVVGYKDERSDS